VDAWRTPESYEERRSRSERAKMRQGPAHHQGSRSLGQYCDAWVSFCRFIYLFIYLFYLITCNRPCVFLAVPLP